MKLNAGIITERLAGSKAFYTGVFGFGVSFENDFYLLLHTPDGGAEFSFPKPHHPSQQPVFQQPFAGKDVYLTLDVPDVAAEYERLRAQGMPMLFDLRREPWGDTHFAVRDSSGIGVDVVTYRAPE